MFCQLLVAMCHIFPITCSSWEILNCLQVHIMFLSLVCDGDFQPASKERSHKHNVSKTRTLKPWQEHFLLNHIRSIFIWNKGCKTTKERTPMIPDYIFPCFLGGFWPVFRMFTRWILRSAALLPAVHLHHLTVLPVLSALSADLSWFNLLWERWTQTKIMVAFHPNLPPDVFIITGIGKSADSLYYKDVKFC